MAETAEEISKRPEIRKELQRATGEKRPETVRARGRDKVWFIIQAVALLGCVAVDLLVGFKVNSTAAGKRRCCGANWYVA